MCGVFFLVCVCREKYLNTLLQVEVMLKLWFPQIHAQAASAAAAPSAAPLHNAPRSLPPHKHRDQSHIPVKVRSHVRRCA